MKLGDTGRKKPFSKGANLMRVESPPNLTRHFPHFFCGKIAWLRRNTVPRLCKHSGKVKPCLEMMGPAEDASRDHILEMPVKAIIIYQPMQAAVLLSMKPRLARNNMQQTGPSVSLSSNHKTITYTVVLFCSCIIETLSPTNVCM